MADLLGGSVAPLTRQIRTGLSVGQPIDQGVVVHHLLEAYGDGQTSYAAYKAHGGDTQASMQRRHHAQDLKM